jgi:hypothetical protein
MNVAFLIGAFVASFLATLRSLGWGFVAMLSAGYLNGVVRARYPGVYTTFMFDAAVLGLYLGFLVRHLHRGPAVGSGAVPFVVFLIGWPAMLSAIPINHILVQLVALRATVWYLPALLIATRLTVADLNVMARGLAVLNLMAFAMGVYIYRNGVEAVYPRNAVTALIYQSRDLAGNRYRIPSTFMNSHTYGGAMLLTLPFLCDLAVRAGARTRDRALAWAGVIAAGGGIMMCGARYPIVLLAVTLILAWMASRFSVKIGALGAVLVAAVLVVASSNERFQRIRTLEDTGHVASRIGGSVNSSFLELAWSYPLGAGMGSSVGTSVPFFLAHLAPRSIGLENEFSRILVDQGWIGLGAWLAFVGWLFLRLPPLRRAPWVIGVLLMYALCLATWLAAFIGTGMLAAVPGAVLFVTEMGVVAGVRSRRAVPGGATPGTAPAGTRRGVPPGMIPGPGGCWLPASGWHIPTKSGPEKR